MSKILLCADLHLHPHKKSVERLRHCIDVLDWVFKTAVKHNIRDIVFLGDLFHDRQKIDVQAYQWAFEIFRKHLENLPTRIYLLLGNHDLFYDQKTDISSVRPLDAIHNIQIIDKPCNLRIGCRDIGFLPFSHNPLEDMANLEKENKDDFKILCGHHAVNGATLNAFWQTKSEVGVEYDNDMVMLDPSVFKAWDQVFLGHYHNAQKLEHVEYIGSPLQLSFGEAFQQKHILIYDLETQEREYIINEFSPKHYIIPMEDVDKYDIGNHFIKFLVDDIAEVDLVEIKLELAAKNPGSIEFTQKSKIKEDKVAVDEARDVLKHADVVEQYIDLTEESWTAQGLDRDKLIAIGRKIMSMRK